MFEARVQEWHREAAQCQGSQLFDYVQASLAAVDGYTDGHTHRVAEYSLVIASHLEGAAGLSYLTFALHDIGKLVLPSELICKPASLTTEEYALIQLHPELGMALIKPFPALHDAADVIACHHERWDGRGYPHRLPGAEIPLAARILSVADTFDAITTDRPYRRAASLEEARFEIMRCAGTQFDPAVVEAFLSAWSTLTRLAPTRPVERVA